MKRLNLLLACMAAVSIQASAFTLFSSMDGPVDLTTMDNGTSKDVLVFVGGPGNAGFIYYQGTRFYVPSGKSTFSTTEDISPYIYTLTKTSDGNYQLQEHVDGNYMPGFVTGSSGNFGSTSSAGTFSAAIVASPTNSINSSYVYKLTNTADNGLAVTKASGALAVNTTNGAEFQFYTFNADEYNPIQLPRYDWTISACSECSGTTANTDGTAAMIIDDDMNTYWHSDWTSTNCTGSSSHANWFMIDLGAEETFTDFTYTARPTSTNGIYTNYQFFASTEAITDVDTYISENEATASGSLPETTGMTSLVRLGKSVTARYLLMVRPHTNSNNFGSCADFKIYSNVITEDEAKAKVTAYKAKFDSFISDMAPFVDSSLISAYNNFEPTSKDVCAECATVDQLADACFSFLNKQTYYIYNTRREEYLASKVSGDNTNSVDHHTDAAKWQFRQVESGKPYFRLFNPNAQGYISTSVATLTTDESSAQQFYLCSDNGAECKTDNSVALRLKDSTNGLNVDTKEHHNDPVSYAYIDGGSSWELSIVATPVADLQTDGFYRIRSNRGYYNQTAGSLLTVSGVLADDINNDLATLTHDGNNAATIWQLKAVDGVEGGYQLLSLVADYTEGNYGLNDPSRSQIAASAEPATYYLLPASQFGITEKFPNGVALSANSTGDGARSCVDVSGSGVPVGQEWKPGTGDSVDNQGSVFYFEEVDNEDLMDVYSAYPATLPTTLSLDSTILSTATDLSTNVPALYPEAIDDRDYTISYDDCVTIKDLTTAYRKVAEPAAEAFSKAVADFYAQPIGKHIQFNQGTYWLGADDSSNVINSVTDGKTYLSTIWQFEAAPEGSTLPYIVKNVASGKYLGYQTFNSQDTYPIVADAADAHIFGFLRNGCGENQVRLSNGVTEAASSNKNCIFLTENTAKIWGNAVGETILTVSGVVYDEMEYPATDDNKVTFANVSKNEHCGDLKITLKPISTTSTPAEAPAIRRISAQSDGSYVIDDSDISSDGAITIPTDGTVASGNYLLTVPAGYFVDSDGNLNAEFSDTFTIGESGTVTSIDELTVDALEAAPAAIYDLQGRRVASPRAGQVYIQGGKLRLN